MKNRTKELSLIALFPALIGATAGISIPLFSLPPITLQTLFVFIAGLLLSPKNSFISLSVYLLLGFIGVPVFSGYTAGLGVLAGPSGGFLLAFPLIAMLTGILKDHVKKELNYKNTLFIVFIGTVFLYMIGATYISVLYKMNIFAVISGFSLYLPGDIVKGIVATLVYIRVQSQLTYERP